MVDTSVQSVHADFQARGKVVMIITMGGLAGSGKQQLLSIPPSIKASHTLSLQPVKYL